jgi:hypothetical protein
MTGIPRVPADADLGDDMPIGEALELARKIGSEHGQATGTWVFDGNTTRATYEWAARGIDDGDPAVLNVIGQDGPSLYGRNAEFTARDLCDKIGVDYDLTETAEVDQIADAYEQEAGDAFWAEVERAARYQLED